MATIYGQGFFSRLRAAAGPAWPAYTEHQFVRALAAGTLNQAAFRHYLIQDYLFLIQFARAFALAAYKSDTLDELRGAAATVIMLAETEMKLHVGFCARWGISEAQMQATPESAANVAYTRYVLERGQAGDLLDLQAALAPCTLGYGEIGAALMASGVAADNPYRPWIEMYGGPEYQAVAARSAAALDASAARRGGDARFAALAKTFTQATQLEARFWQMALDLAD